MKRIIPLSFLLLIAGNGLIVTHAHTAPDLRAMLAAFTCYNVGIQVHKLSFQYNNDKKGFDQNVTPNCIASGHNTPNPSENPTSLTNKIAWGLYGLGTALLVYAFAKH